MRAKLIKPGHSYALLLNENLVAFAHPEDFNSGVEIGKLSLENCQAIERGYDVYDLAKENYHKFWSVVDESEMLDHTFGYVEGFQKALELMGDKKFTEGQMLKAFIVGVFTEDNSDHDFEFQELMSDLEKSEWDVEIIMDIDAPCTHCGEEENLHGNYDYTLPDRPLIETLCNECGKYFKPVPKLDSNGCLILKVI